MKKLKDLIKTINKLESEGKDISLEVKNNITNGYGTACLLRNYREVKNGWGGGGCNGPSRAKRGSARGGGSGSKS